MTAISPPQTLTRAGSSFVVGLAFAGPVRVCMGGEPLLENYEIGWAEAHLARLTPV